MIVSCPACSTRFEFDLSLLGDNGRKLRCGKCAHEWVHQPQADQDPAVSPQSALDPVKVEAAPAPEGLVTSRRQPPPRRIRTRRSNYGLIAGWVFLVIFLLVVVGGAWLLRDEVVRAVPQMARLYELVEGPPPPPGAGLTLENVVSVRKKIEGDRVLLIEGEVVNVIDRVVAVPGIAATLTDAEGKALKVWLVTPDAAELEPGESTRFQTTARNLPTQGVNLSIDFAKSENLPSN